MACTTASPTAAPQAPGVSLVPPSPHNRGLQSPHVGVRPLPLPPQSYGSPPPHSSAAHSLVTPHLQGLQPPLHNTLETAGRQSGVSRVTRGREGVTLHPPWFRVSVPPPPSPWKVGNFQCVGPGGAGCWGGGQDAGGAPRPYNAWPHHRAPHTTMRGTGQACKGRGCARGGGVRRAVSTRRTREVGGRSANGRGGMRGGWERAWEGQECARAV